MKAFSFGQFSIQTKMVSTSFRQYKCKCNGTGLGRSMVITSEKGLTGQSDALRVFGSFHLKISFPCQGCLTFSPTSRVVESAFTCTCVW